MDDKIIFKTLHYPGNYRFLAHFLNTGRLQNSYIAIAELIC